MRFVAEHGPSSGHIQVLSAIVLHALGLPRERAQALRTHGALLNRDAGGILAW